MCNRYDRSVRTMLDADLSGYVDDEVIKTGLSASAVLRQALLLRRASQRRAAEIEADMLANEGAC